jgi:hypothetical protein
LFCFVIKVCALFCQIASILFLGAEILWINVLEW